MRRQFFDLRLGETLFIGDSSVTLEAKTGARARLRVESDEATHKGRADMARPQPPAPTEQAAPPFVARPRIQPDVNPFE